MRSLRPRFPLAVAAVLVAALLPLACTQGDSGSPLSGDIRIYLTDAPADFDEVWVTLDGLDVHRSGGAWFGVPLRQVAADANGDGKDDVIPNPDGSLDVDLLALRDGTVRTWGGNPSGQLGDGTTAVSLSPVQVVDPSDPTGFLTDIIAVDAEGGRTMALKSDGTVRTWGQNHLGQLGDGTTTNSSIPVTVIDPSDPTMILQGVASVGAGRDHSIASVP